MLNDKGEEVGIIYGWYNTKSEKWYIGQTIRPEARFKRHINYAINKKDNNKFHNALRKYGLDNFVYCVLEENVLVDNLDMMEIYWIEEFDSFYSGYNLTLGGDGLKGFIMPEEQKKKISQSNKGKTKNHLSEETKKKLSESHKGNPGYWTNKHLSEEIRKRISESHKGKTSPNRKKVLQYDLNFNYIQTFNSLKEAQEKTNIAKSSICTVCKGRIKQAGGFIWKYAS